MIKDFLRVRLLLIRRKIETNDSPINPDLDPDKKTTKQVTTNKVTLNGIFLRSGQINARKNKAVAASAFGSPKLPTALPVILPPNKKIVPSKAAGIIR